MGGNYANPLQTWSNLGKPRTLNKEQRKILMAASEPLQTDVKLFDEKGFYKVKLTIQCNHLYMLEILPVKDFTDTYDGFEPDEFFGLE